MQWDQILWQKEPQKYVFAKKKKAPACNYLITTCKYSHRARGKESLKRSVNIVKI